MQRIFIVEDEIIVARDTQAMLEILGYEGVGIAVSGREAIRTATRLKPDLILMDIKLKGNRNGIETAASIRKIMDVPIIYMTAFADDELIEQAKRTEPFGYLLKPFQEKELQISIEMALYKHQMEKQLRISGEKYQKLFEQSNDAVFIMSIEGVVQDVNGRACEMLGYDKNELIKLKILDLHEPADYAVALFAMNETRKNGFNRFESRFKRKDGSLIDVESSARIFDEDQQIVQWIVRDITEKKQVEADIRRMNMLLEERVRVRTEEITEANQALKKLSLAVEQSSSIVFTTNRDGVIKYVNRKFTEVTGYESEEIIGKNPKILNAGQLPGSFYAKLWKTILKGEEWRGDLCNKRKDQTFIWMHTSILPIVNEANEITNFIAVAEDITKKRRIDEELKRYTEELEMFNESMVNREMKMIELKEEVNALLNELGRDPKYPPVWKTKT